MNRVLADNISIRCHNMDRFNCWYKIQSFLCPILQGFISAKHRGRRRDSIISSVNTDYTYEESIQAPSLIGTEYEGHSQRSSLTSNIVMDPQAEGRMSSVCGTEYEGDNSQRSSLTSNHHEQITFQVSETVIMFKGV